MAGDDVTSDNQVDPEDFLHFCLGRRRLLGAAAGVVAGGLGGFAVAACGSNGSGGNDP